MDSSLCLIHLYVSPVGHTLKKHIIYLYLFSVIFSPLSPADPFILRYKSLWPISDLHLCLSLHQSISQPGLIPLSGFRSPGLEEALALGSDGSSDEEMKQIRLLSSPPDCVCVRDESSPSEVLRRADYVTEPMKQGYCVRPKNSGDALKRQRRGADPAETTEEMWL